MNCELADRLKTVQLRGNTTPADSFLLHEAADRLEELEAEVTELRRAKATQEDRA